jgi:periplasmic copper chaperone A
MIKTPIFAMLSLIFPALANADTTAGIPGIEIHDAWIAEAPPVSTVNAAYMRIINTSAADTRIESVSCENFSSAQFHRTVYVNGMASMRPLDELILPAGTDLVFKPGDYHIMLFNPVHALHSGDESQCTLKLGDGRSIQIKLDVKKSSADY